MKVLQHLTLVNLQKNKRRTAVTIIGVILSSALILAVVGMVTSFQKMMVNYAIAERGDFHEMFQEVPVEALQYVEQNQHVESYYYSKPLTKNDLDEDIWGTYQTYQHQPYKAEYYERLDTLPSDAKGTYDIYVRYDNPKEYEANREVIQNAIESATGKYINYRTNGDLLRYEAMVMGDAALATLYSMAVIVIGIIVVTSVFVIRNSFSISATERMRQFGMLSSVGATPRQIRHSIFFEGLVIGAIGIPLGILLGIAAVAILVWIVNTLLAGMIEGAVVFSMPFWVFPVAIGLSLVTIFFSSLMPAIRAGRMSPIEAIRGNQDIKVKAKKLRTSKLVKKTFGIGGVIADKNLKRSRKKYRTTVVSIVLSVATFVGLYSFIHYGQDMIGLQYSNTDIDFAMSGNDDVEIYQDLISRFNLKETAIYRQHSSSHEIPIFAMDEKSFAEFAKSVGVHEKDYSQVVLLNDYGMNMREEGGYALGRVTDLKDGDTYKMKVVPEVPEKCVTQEPLEMDGNQIGYYVNIEEACVNAAGAGEYETEVQITKMISEYPLGYEDAHMPMMIVPATPEFLKQFALDKEYMSQFYAANVEDVPAITSYLDQYFEDNKTTNSYYYTDVKEGVSEMRRMYLLISIFLYGFVIVVTLIGVTNIFNTITTNIALRAKEFAMLKSIGMTGKEFNHMIRLESLMYASKALIIGIPLGLLLSYAFYQSIANSVDFGWSIPWMAILISVVAVGLLISIIMRYSVKQVEKQNIIETIRSENI